MKKKALAGRDLLRLMDLSREEFAHIIKTAIENKRYWQRDPRAMQMLNIYGGRAVGIILEKPSLRTRVSFELATSHLGAYPVVMSDTTSAFSRGESLKDTTMVLERYVDAIVIRSFAQSRVEEIAAHAGVPVINALTDDFHPCQGLADFMTIYEKKCWGEGAGAASGMATGTATGANAGTDTGTDTGAATDANAGTATGAAAGTAAGANGASVAAKGSGAKTAAGKFDLDRLAKIKLAYVGDGNNMAHTYMEGGALSGMEVRIATPKGYEPMKKYVDECEQAAKATGAKLLYTNDMAEALAGADVVITDTWASMGSEAEHDERVRVFSPFQINAEVMQLAAPDAIFMHCLPAHRGEEVSDEVMDAPYSAIYDEAENRLHAQQALLQLVMEC